MDEWMNCCESDVLILHPGSLYLGLGRASDTGPVRALHCIARRRKLDGGLFNELQTDQGEPWGYRQQQTVDLLYQALRRKQDKQPGSIGGSSDQTSLLHESDLVDRARAQNISNRVQVEEQVWMHPVDQRPYLVADEIKENADAEYNLHFPYKGGDFNLHAGIGGSLTSVITDLTTIWSHLISEHLGINPAQFCNYKVILIIPSVYNRVHVKHLLTLLLINLGFQAAFPLQEDVAATFGSGNSVACVVDIGHEKTCVSCVEDATSHPRTRLVMQYGSRHVTNVLMQLCKTVCFPYVFDDGCILDFLLLQSIKEAKSNLDMDHVSVDQHEFTVTKYSTRLATQSTFSFQLATGREGLIASMSLFQPELLLYGGPRYLRGMSTDQGDPEDPHDNNYLRETSRKYNKGDIQGEESEFDDMDQAIEQGTNESGLEPVLPLDQAILKSISNIQSEDIRRRMLVNIVLVGGGANLKGLQAYLQNKLNTQVPGGVEVLKETRECGLDSICWRGGAILSTMETAQELWIKPAEWKKSGVKLLRERSLSSWQ